MRACARGCKPNEKKRCNLNWLTLRRCEDRDAGSKPAEASWAIPFNCRSSLVIGKRRGGGCGAQLAVLISYYNDGQHCASYSERLWVVSRYSDRISCSPQALRMDNSTFIDVSVRLLKWRLLWWSSVAVPFKLNPVNMNGKGRTQIPEDRVLRKVFGPKREQVAGGCWKYYYQDFYNLYSWLNVSRMIR
jgi:hypothetical protein